MRYKESEARRTPRFTVPLGDSFSKRLTGYAAMAGAAGVGLLAAATPAQADIVYTPANITFKTGSSLYLDINHDGTNDFFFRNEADLGLGSTTFLIVSGLQNGNGVRGGASGFGGASVLPRGAKIAPGGKFLHSATMADAYNGSIGGPWGEVKNRYLGLEFRLNGEQHFGWAEFTVTKEGDGFGIRATLEGYAYETDPNTPIRAGQKSENAEEPDSATPAQTEDGILPTVLVPGQSDAATAPASVKRDGLDSAPGTASLGLLALGSLGLGFWRRKQEAEVRGSEPE